MKKNKKENMSFFRVMALWGSIVVCSGCINKSQMIEHSLYHYTPEGKRGESYLVQKDKQERAEQEYNDRQQN